jgi:hypothetical protein
MRPVNLIGAAALIFMGMTAGQAPKQPAIRFTKHIVDQDGVVNPWLKTVGDINQDGKVDLIAGCRTEGGLAWYENPAWKKHRIAGGKFSTDGEVADMDGDGDPDVVAIVLEPSGLAWFENPGWKMHMIGNEVLHDVETADLDGDGDVDLVARDQGSFTAGNGDKLHFYRHDPGGRWTHGTLAIADGEGLSLADIDGDGDRDAVIGRVWYENTGDPLAKEWTPHEYGSDWTYPFTFVAAGRVNRDRRPDIALSPAERAKSRYRISWFEAPVDPKSAPWKEHVVDASVEAVHHFIGIADFNGDGLGDIATAEMHQGEDPDEVSIYLNPGTGGHWNKVVIATIASHSMRIADLDGDGDMDLYGANWTGRTIEWWENLSR